MTERVQGVVTLLVPLLLQIIILSFSVLVDPYIRKRHKRLLLAIAGLILSLLLQNLLYDHFRFIAAPDLWFTALSVYGYCVRPMVLMLFIRLVDTGNRYRFFWVLVAVNAVIYMTAFVSDVTFRISGGLFIRGPLGWTCHIVSLVLILFHLVQTLAAFRAARKPEAMIPVFSAVLIIAATVVDSWFVTDYVISALTITVIGGSLFYYIWLHLQFVHEHEQALMAQQRIRIMMSQIQPHFLYNTLSTIQALCRTDPEKAFDTLEIFGTYLRQNIDTLDQPARIPFLSELKHTQIYTEIEMLRFPTIQIEYDIQDSDFTIPALTVQPIVENAIRHGVRIRSQGMVSIHTFKEQGDHVIRIVDNGKGFDPNINYDPDEAHIGIQNVRARIERLCGGALLIDSEIDKGTTVTIRIPQGKEQP